MTKIQSPSEVRSVDLVRTPVKQQTSPQQAAKAVTEQSPVLLSEAVQSFRDTNRSEAAFDAKRVAAVKAAIEAGSFSVDVDSIVSGLLEEMA